MSTDSDTPLTTPPRWRVGLIGYGEVGRIVAEDLRAQDRAICTYDVKLPQAAAAVLLKDHAAKHGVRLATSHADAAAGVDLLISAVTADQTVDAAQAASLGLKPRAFFLDLNSASPSSKIAAADAVSAVRGRFVEGAVMTSMPPYRLRVPLLLGGPHAEALLAPLTSLGFTPRVASEQLGVAAATKM